MSKHQWKNVKKFVVLIAAVIVMLIVCSSTERPVYAATSAEADSAGYSWYTDFGDGTGKHYMLNLPVTDWKSSAPYNSTMGGTLGVDFIRQSGHFVLNPVTWVWSDIMKLTMTNSNVWTKHMVNGKQYDVTYYGDGMNYLTFYRYEGTFYIDPAYDMTGMNFAIIPTSESKYCYIDDDAYYFIYPACIKNEINDSNFMDYLVFWVGTQMIWEQSSYFHGVRGASLNNSWTGEAFQVSSWWSLMKPANASAVVARGYERVKNRSDYDGNWCFTVVYAGNASQSSSYRSIIGAEFKVNQILYDGNGATSGENQVQYQNYGETVSIKSNWFEKSGSVFVGWNDREDGSGTWYMPGDKYSSVKPLVLFAQWKTYARITTHHYKWNSNDSAWEFIITVTETVECGTYYKPSYITMPTGYHKGGIDDEDGWIVTGDRTIAAYYLPNMYTFIFDANGGSGSIDGETVPYDGYLTLPDGSMYFERYTLGGVQTETESDDQFYVSIFLGWNLSEDKTSYTSRWEVGDVITVNELASELGLSGEESATIYIYAIWDDCPWIEACDLYYPLEMAKNGGITEEEILSHATASDREDGSPIEAGYHENGTSFYIADYSADDFIQFVHSGSCTESLTVTDSAGSTYKKMITVYIADTSPQTIESDKASRFIDEKYYYAGEEAGGLSDDSVWKCDTEYASELVAAFSNIKNDTPVATYYFDHAKIMTMREYIETNRMFDTHGLLYDFYMRFIAEAF